LNETPACCHCVYPGAKSVDHGIAQAAIRRAAN
jgi:hypothetical protein